MCAARLRVAALYRSSAIGSRDRTSRSSAGDTPSSLKSLPSGPAPPPSCSRKRAHSVRNSRSSPARPASFSISSSPPSKVGSCTSEDEGAPPVAVASEPPLSVRDLQREREERQRIEQRPSVSD